jgi:hypothetical protein
VAAPNSFTPNLSLNETADHPPDTRARPFVTRKLHLILLAIVLCVAGADAVWVRVGHFDVDAPAYGLIALLALACSVGGIFYERIRKDERLAAMLFGTSFLLAMSASFSVLNYLLLTVAGPRIDLQLAAIDRAMGVDWPAMIAFVANYPITNAVLQLVYVSVLPQIALLLIAIGLIGKPQRIYALSLSVACGAAVSIAVWTAAPSFGAFSVYDLPQSVSGHIALALDGHYAKQLVALLAHGPGHISPSDAKGLIGFPSYHAALALIVVWYARELPVIRWIVAGLNAVVLIATPIQGGHHVIDVVAGAGVAALAVLFANAVIRLAGRTRGAVVLGPQPATR